MLRVKHRDKTFVLRIGILFLILVLIPFLIFKGKYSEIVHKTALNEAKRVAVKNISKAVEECVCEYENMFVKEVDSNGNLKEINVDISSVNKLKEKVSESINDIFTSSVHKVKVPLGTLTGNEFFYGRGPKATIKIVYMGNADTNFRSEFSSGGINQTVYRLYVDISAQIYTFLPGENTEEVITTSVMIGETVIIGETPNIITNLKGLSD